MSSSIGSVCQKTPDTITPDESVLVAAERMRQRTVGSLVVVDEANRPVGIITDRDLVIRALADGRAPAETSASEVMTPDIVVVTADSSISSALRRMREGTFRRLPIVDSHGHLTGIVTLDDILMLLARELDEIGNVLDQETPGAAAYRA